MSKRLQRIATACLSVVLLTMIAPSAGARPDYHQQFLADPLRRANVEGCGVCHQDAAGGGPRNEFGQAFAEAGLVITPMMRATFADLYDVPAATVGERGRIYFSDPDNRNAVVEIGEERYLVELPSEALNVVPATEESAGEDTFASSGGAPEHFSFFVTSVGLGKGGNLGSIAGADRHCQSLAESVGAGARTWRAYLSTSIDGAPAVNAGDRIGTGPWHNIKGVRIARGVADLHSQHNTLNRETALTETGETPSGPDILTGTLLDGTASAMTCENWTSSGEGSALVGRFDRQVGDDDSSSWNSAHASEGCSHEDLTDAGGEGLFYCFAVD